MTELADRLARQAEELACHAESDVSQARRAEPLFWPGLLMRNLVFLAIVLLHGVRRLLPPW